MKKELLTVLIVITLVISLSACGKTTHTQVETSETTSLVEQTTTIEEVITSEKNTTQTSSYKFKGNYIG